MKWNPEPLTQQEEEFLQLNLSDEGGRKKKKEHQGREGGRRTQQKIHLFTKSYGSWKVEKNIMEVFFNKAKNQFLDNQHWEDIFSSKCMFKIQPAKKENLSHAEI